MVSSSVGESVNDAITGLGRFYPILSSASLMNDVALVLFYLLVALQTLLED